MIDTSTNTVYLTHKAYDSRDNSVHWYMDALNIATGAEQPGWPVELTTGGAADNAPGHLQPEDPAAAPRAAADERGRLCRLRLALRSRSRGKGGSSASPTTGAKITAKWIDGGTERRRHLAVGRRAHLGRPGQILFATGNGGSPTSPAPEASRPTRSGSRTSD